MTIETTTTTPEHPAPTIHITQDYEIDDNGLGGPMLTVGATILLPAASETSQ